MMKQFPVHIALRIDWADMDLFGHVNNVAYFRYIQASRVNYWEVTGLAADFESTGVGPILLSTGCQFIKPLFYPGNIRVEASVEFMKNTSFGIHHRIVNQQEEVVAEAHDVIVIFDFKRNEKAQLPGHFRQAIMRLEGHNFDQ
jgi:acyl-CoA thioester hydrolase